MKAAQANILNAIVLIAAGIIGYFVLPNMAGSDGKQSFTALIPAAFGLLFLALHKGLVAQNKIIAHVVVVLTFVLLIMCTSRFFKVDGWNEKKYIFLACIITNTVALIAFIGSFIEARKNREKANG
jgi:peptidoglycan/LPS O-acetylase OafA/YrhL